MGPLNQLLAGHLIMTLLRWPSLDRMVDRHLTSAGSPHLTLPSRSRYFGQSKNIILVPH
jgi:hypothetical protein